MDIVDSRKPMSWKRTTTPRPRPRPLQPIPIQNNNPTRTRYTNGGSVLREQQRDQKENWPHPPTHQDKIPKRPSTKIELSSPCLCGVPEPPLVRFTVFCILLIFTIVENEHRIPNFVYFVNSSPSHDFDDDFLRCCDCEVNLCASCAYKHKRVKSTQDDVLVPLGGSLSPNSSDKMLFDGFKENRICGPHDPAKSLLYCETCCEAVCGVCYPAEHIIHEVVTIRDALERAQITNNWLKAEATYGFRSMSALIEKTNKAMLSIHGNSKDTEREIQNAMNEVRRLIDDREKDLKCALKAAFTGQSNALQEDLESFRKIQAANSRVYKVIAEKEMTDPFDVLRIQGLCRHDLSLTKAREQNALMHDIDVVFEAPDDSLMLSLTTAGKVMTLDRNPFNGTIGSELKRCRSYSPQEPNKKPALDYSSDSNQEDSPNAPFLPIWNPWNDVSDVVQRPLLVNVAYGTLPSPPKCDVKPIPQRAEPAVPPQPVFRVFQAPKVNNYIEVGRPKFVIGKVGANDGELSRPWGICCDHEGNFIIADRSNHRIQIFSPKGIFKYKFGTFGKKDPATFDRPAGVAVGYKGRIIVVDKDNHRVQVFTRDCNFLFMFGGEGSHVGQFHYPWDVAVNSKGEMAVSDTRNHRIQLFSKDGTFLQKFGFENLLHCCKHFDSPRGLSFTANGSVLVTDFNNHRLVIIDPEFRAAKYTGSAGCMQKQFMRPQGVAIDPEGNIVVADSRNSRIQIFTEDGTYICQFGSAGKNLGQFDRPSGICFTPDGKIAVVDFGNNRVQVF